jgi:hypothetical protein
MRNGIFAVKGKQKIVSNDCSWNNASGIEITQKVSLYFAFDNK